LIWVGCREFNSIIAFKHVLADEFVEVTNFLYANGLIKNFHRGFSGDSEQATEVFSVGRVG
jgi:hypothetical protein